MVQKEAEQVGKAVIESAIVAFRSNKGWADKAVAQLPDEKLHVALDPNTNCIAVIMKHVAGNLLSRWTDFLTTDGEKPWRNRDSEFETLDNSRKDLEEMWAIGWGVLEDQLARLTDNDLPREVFIRGEVWSVHGALSRSLAHVSYHVGQMVTLARLLCSSEWQWVTIPKGKSQEFNQKVRNLKISEDKVP